MTEPERRLDCAIFFQLRDSQDERMSGYAVVRRIVRLAHPVIA